SGNRRSSRSRSIVPMPMLLAPIPLPASVTMPMRVRIISRLGPQTRHHHSSHNQKTDNRDQNDMPDRRRFLLFPAAVPLLRATVLVSPAAPARTHRISSRPKLGRSMFAFFRHNGDQSIPENAVAPRDRQRQKSPNALRKSIARSSFPRPPLSFSPVLSPARKNSPKLCRTACISS